MAQTWAIAEQSRCKNMNHKSNAQGERVPNNSSKQRSTLIEPHDNHREKRL
jgi:hypothetical protein